LTENEVPLWIKYAGDIFFLIAFLVILFFFKADPESSQEQEALSNEELPNSLEQVLKTDESEDSTDKSDEIMQ
jgi:hypothetical protein